jgi:hypothetical protein
MVELGQAKIGDLVRFAEFFRVYTRDDPSYSEEMKIWIQTCIFVVIKKEQHFTTLRDLTSGFSRLFSTFVVSDLAKHYEIIS